MPHPHATGCPSSASSAPDPAGAAADSHRASSAPDPAGARPRLRSLATAELRVGPPRLGEWLVRRGLITRVELFLALDAAYRHRCRLGDALVWLETLSRNTIEIEATRFTGHCARRRGLSLTPTRDNTTT